MKERTCAVINPAASRGRAHREWKSVAPRLRDALGPFDAVFTDAPQAATQLAREALHAGAELVVSVGGDGTLNEVVNGFFAPNGPHNPDAHLGVLMVGTGGDFKRTIGLPEDTQGQIARIAAGTHRAIDVGRLTVGAPGGPQRVSYFDNICSFGLSGATDSVVNALTYAKLFGGKFAFQWGMLKALVGYKNRAVRIQVDDHFDETLRISTVAVAIGQYFGGGMRVAPNAVLDDGLFDVIIVGDISKAELVRRVNKVYTGAHIGLHDVTVLRGRRVVATPVDPVDAVLIDSDGEVAGSLPATFEVVPSVLRVRA